jgi:hypothetical protein
LILAFAKMSVAMKSNGRIAEPRLASFLSHGERHLFKRLRR